MNKLFPALLLMPLILTSREGKKHVVYRTLPAIEKASEHALKVETAPKNKKVKGQICDLYDNDVHESQKVFLAPGNMGTTIYRYDEVD